MKLEHMNPVLKPILIKSTELIFEKILNDRSMTSLLGRAQIFEDHMEELLTHLRDALLNGVKFGRNEQVDYHRRVLSALKNLNDAETDYKLDLALANYQETLNDSRYFLPTPLRLLLYAVGGILAATVLTVFIAAATAGPAFGIMTAVWTITALTPVMMTGIAAAFNFGEELPKEIKTIENKGRDIHTFLATKIGFDRAFTPSQSAPQSIIGFNVR